MRREEGFFASFRKEPPPFFFKETASIPDTLAIDIRTTLLDVRREHTVKTGTNGGCSPRATAVTLRVDRGS